MLRSFGGVKEFRRARAYRHPLGPGFDSLHLHHFFVLGTAKSFIHSSEGLRIRHYCAVFSRVELFQVTMSHLAAARTYVSVDPVSTYDQKFIHFCVESRGET